MITIATYLFIVTFAGQSYILDSHQTLADCGRDIEAGVQSIQIDDTHTLNVPETATFSCEAQK